MEKKIRVVRVLDEYKAVLNVGSKDGVDIGHTYVVFVEDQENLIDPSTGELLGHLELLRGKGKVIHVQDKMCTIESIEKGTSRRVIRRTSNPVYSNLLGGGAETEEFEPKTLPFERIAVGDKARRIG